MFASILLLTTLVTTATAPSPDAFDEPALAAAVWRHAPDLAAARSLVLESESLRQRARLYPNPALTLQWGTIPLGERNPPGLAWDRVPNYTVGISQLIELGKRGPRQQAADAGGREAAFNLQATYVDAFFAVMESLSDQAAAVARMAILDRLVAGSTESVRLQRARADKGDVASIEVDRLEVEALRLRAARRDAEAMREGALARCSQVLGSACPRFSGEDDALRFLSRRPDLPAPDEARVVAQRPDIRLAEATRERAAAEERLAGHRAIPDPVASVAYTHDRFIAAGNQADSLTLNVALPLPLFDRGQPEQRRARAEAALAAERRQTLIQAAQATVAAGRSQLSELTARAQVLDELALPKARSVVHAMEEAARRGGVALPDVLLARRAFEELELDRIEVANDSFRVALALRRQTGLVPPPPTSP